jgi:hypothetical protein
MSEYKTCKHIYDTGGACNSVAAVGRNYCVNHLRHRARLVRIAQARAPQRALRLETPSPRKHVRGAVGAQPARWETVATDMLDLKRARFLLSVRAAGQFLMHPEKWQANLYHSDQAA